MEEWQREQLSSRLQEVMDRLGQDSEEQIKNELGMLQSDIIRGEYG